MHRHQARGSSTGQRRKEYSYLAALPTWQRGWLAVSLNLDSMYLHVLVFVSACSLVCLGSNCPVKLQLSMRYGEHGKMLYADGGVKLWAASKVRCRRWMCGLTWFVELIHEAMLRKL